MVYIVYKLAGTRLTAPHVWCVGVGRLHGKMCHGQVTAEACTIVWAPPLVETHCYGNHGYPGRASRRQGG